MSLPLRGLTYPRTRPVVCQQQRSVFGRACRAIVLFVVGLVLPMQASSAQGGTSLSPVGTWHTLDDVDSKPSGIVVIREEKGVLIGTVRGSLRKDEQDNPMCDKCPGARKGKPIVGMDILTGLRADGDEWTGGEILDPDTGKVYKVKIRLTDGGKKLVLRGFIGFSLIGQSQTWVRAD
ncbi:MAG: DUF2147 domain-containing protein [Gemmatimonas sp.]|jgi:uncharacterized protein (DUF2147 family)|uniref:DUF2147 domain-containing protein n=1 Tax=Gemmatimonas sp. TaxID=1962908 RepID=UPI0031C09807|nr:DUF2147 domain-containing protein [Gemmatimonas sp.]